MHKNKKIGLWLILGLVVVFNVLFTIQTAASATDLTQIEQDQAELTKANDELKLELVEQSSLSKLGEKAQELGYDKPQAVVYAKLGEPVAQLP